MNLSEHFTLGELTRSQTALRKGVNNTPNDAQRANLERLCVVLLEPIRALLGVPLQIDSGYRSAVINTLVGGAAHSAHLDGRAADVIPLGMSLEQAFQSIRSSSLPFDQLIIECGIWLHVSIPPVNGQPRREVLAATGSPGNWSYQRVA